MKSPVQKVEMSSENTALDRQHTTEKQTVRSSVEHVLVAQMIALFIFTRGRGRFSGIDVELRRPAVL